MITLPLIAVFSGIYMIRKGLSDTAPLINSPMVSGSTKSAKMASIKKAYGPMLRKYAGQIGIPESVAAAILAIESSGNGFAKDGRIIIRYEPHIFERYTGLTSKAKRAGQSAEYGNLERAIQLDENGAYLSISMGIGQIMGFNHKIVGYSSPKKMFEAFSVSIEPQIAAMFKFIANKKSILEAAREGDFARFAHGYNGPGYRANKYDTKMAELEKIYRGLE